MNSKSSDFLLEIIQSTSSTEDEVCEAAQLLLIEGNQRAIQPIIKRLIQKQDPPWVRNELVTTLGGLTATSNVNVSEDLYLQATSLLLTILTSEAENEDVRGSAALSLGIMEVDTAVSPLIELIRSGNEKLLYSCVMALGCLKSKEAIPVLSSLLNTKEIPLLKAVIDALGNLGNHAEPVAPELHNFVDNEHEVIRRAAKEALSKIS